MTAGTSDLSRLRRDQVSVCDLAAYAHILVVCTEEPDVVATEVGDITGVDMPTEAGAVHEAVPRTAFWLSPRSWLVRLSENQVSTALAAMLSRFPDRCVHATPYSDALAWVEIAGPDVASLLARGGFVSLARSAFPVGRVKRTLIADIPVLIWRVDADRWQIGVERSRAPYFKQWIESTIAIGDGGSKE